MTDTNKCFRCGHCCTYSQITYEKNDHNKDVSKWMQLHGCRIVENDKIHIFFPVTCSWLAQDRETKKYYCANYDQRPQMCRDYNCKSKGKEVTV